MLDVYNLKDLTATLGLESTHAARKRVNALRELLQRRELLVYIPEEGGALGVKGEGLRLLQRLQEIGKEGKTLAQATDSLLIELGEKKEEPKARELKLFEVRIRAELGELRTRIEKLERKVEKKRWWEWVLMLPKGKEKEVSERDKGP